jgi:hypothetical protein
VGSAFGAKRIVLLQMGRELKFPRSRLFGKFARPQLQGGGTRVKWMAGYLCSVTPLVAA